MDADSGVGFQGGKTALHTNRESARFGVRNVECVFNDDVARTFYIYRSTTIVTRFAQNSFPTSRATQYNPTGADAQGFSNRKGSFAQ